MTGGVRSEHRSVRVIDSIDSIDPVPPVATVGVDLGTDPISRLLLIEGIGSVTAQKITRARVGDSGFRCLCQVMRVAGVPDRPLLEAGPWLSPRPCIGGPEMCQHPGTESSRGGDGNR